MQRLLVMAGLIPQVQSLASFLAYIYSRGILSDEVFLIFQLRQHMGVEHRLEEASIFSPILLKSQRCACLV